MRGRSLKKAGMAALRRRKFGGAANRRACIASAGTAPFSACSPSRPVSVSNHRTEFATPHNRSTLDNQPPGESSPAGDDKTAGAWRGTTAIRRCSPTSSATLFAPKAAAPGQAHAIPPASLSAFS